MAETWTVDCTQVAMAPNKSLVSLWNGVGSAKVIRVYRIFAGNGNIGPAVIGYLCSMGMCRISAHAGGRTFTPVPRDTNNSALDANVVAASGATSVTSVGYFKRWLWSTTQAASGLVGSSLLAAWELQYSATCLWDMGYSHSGLQPITLRAGQGICIHNIGSSSTGIIDFWLEFTQADT